MKKTDVVVIGGGATGCGVAWDLALRGLGVTLVEMGDVATGSSGRYHGLLHSGSRYVTSDQKSARECSQEQAVIRRVAPHVVDDTGGLFVLSPSDDEGFIEPWLEGCRAAGIQAGEIGVSEALRREPLIHKGIGHAYEVPDASCNSSVLCNSLRSGAEDLGTTFLTYHRVENLHKENGRVGGARVVDLRTNEATDIECAMVVNASGPWSSGIGEKAGVEYDMDLSRGAMLAFNGRWTNAVVSRLRSPGDGDIFVPLGYTGVAGTTSVPTDDPYDTRIEDWERERIISETEAFLPGIRRATVLRSWAGVRPLYDPEADVEESTERGHADSREATRTFDVLDHASKDNVEGFVSIVGGKLTTFRLMAEATADTVCNKLGVDKPCATKTTEIPHPKAREAA